MAVTLTKNIRLRVDSNLTSSAKYNLERIDQLGGSLSTDTLETVHLRSRQTITLEPEAAAIGGSGAGGIVNIGTVSHPISEFNIYTENTVFFGGVALRDFSAPNKLLSLRHDSGGDTTENRTLTFDTDDGNRSLRIGTDLFISGIGTIALSAPANSVLVLPPSGTVLTDTSSAILTNKSISGSTNPLTDIAYTSLVLANSIVNGDISSDAGIARSKLASGSNNHVVINDASGVFSSEQFLSITRGGTGAGTAQDATTNLLPTQAGQAGKALVTNGFGVLSWALASGTVNKHTQDWTTGTSIVINHLLLTSDVIVSVKDDSNKLVGVDEIEITSNSSLTITSSQAPVGVWRVTVMG